MSGYVIWLLLVHCPLKNITLLRSQSEKDWCAVMGWYVSTISAAVAAWQWITTRLQVKATKLTRKRSWQSFQSMICFNDLFDIDATVHQLHVKAKNGLALSYRGWLVLGDYVQLLLHLQWTNGWQRKLLHNCFFWNPTLRRRFRAFWRLIFSTKSRLYPASIVSVPWVATLGSVTFTDMVSIYHVSDWLRCWKTIELREKKVNDIQTAISETRDRRWTRFTLNIIERA